MMSLRRFDALARCYGADLRRWPDADRAAATLLLSSDTGAGARAIRDRQQPLDTAIGDALAADAAECWQEGEETAALARLRDSVDRRIGAQMQSPGRIARPAWASAHAWTRALDGMFPTGLSPHPVQRAGARFGRGAVGRGVGLAMGSGVVVLTGYWLGMMHRVGAPSDLFGALQALPFGGAGL